MFFNDLLSGGLLGSIGSTISSIIGARSAKKQTDKVVAAQQAANNANIASQERINQAQIEHNDYINSLMRHDANNAISIKKRDLINAGYSTADPTFSGNTTATLGNATLNAPQVESEYPTELAGINQSAAQSITDALLNSSTLSTDVALKKAEIREKNSKSSYQDILNSWANVQQQVSYDTALQALDNLKKDGHIKDNELTKFTFDLNLLHRNIDIAGEQLQNLKITNSKLADKIDSEISKLLADIAEAGQNVVESQARVGLANKQGKVFDAQAGKLIAETNEVNATTENIRQDTINKKKLGQNIDLDSTLKKLDARSKQLDNWFAERGINFRVSGVFNTLLSVLAAPEGKEVLPTFINFVSDSLGALIDRSSADTNPITQSIISHGKKWLGNMKKNANKSKRGKNGKNHGATGSW